MKSRIFFIFLLLIFIIGYSDCTVAADSTSTNSISTPNLRMYVTDLSGTLSNSEISAIDDLCKSIDTQTSAEIAVLLMDINTSDSTISNFDMNDYATETFTKNGIGKEGKDNGILIIVNTYDNDWIIQVGYGLEGVFNDAKLAKIGRENLEPHIDVSDYSNGVYSTVTALGKELINDPNSVVIKKSWFANNWKLILAIFIFILILILTKGQAFIWIGNIFSGGRFGGGGTGGGMGKR